MHVYSQSHDHSVAQCIPVYVRVKMCSTTLYYSFTVRCGHKSLSTICIPYVNIQYELMSVLKTTAKQDL